MDSLWFMRLMFFFPMISETLWLVTAFPIGFPEVLAGKERWRQRQRCLGLVFQGAAQSWDWAAVSKWHWVAMDDSSQVPAACLGRSRPKSFCQLSLHKWPEGLGRFRKAHEHAIFAADIESVKNNTSGRREGCTPENPGGFWGAPNSCGHCRLHSMSLMLSDWGWKKHIKPAIDKQTNRCPISSFHWKNVPKTGHWPVSITKTTRNDLNLLEVLVQDCPGFLDPGGGRATGRGFCASHGGNNDGRKGRMAARQARISPELAGRGGFHKHHLVVIFLVINGGEYIILHESSWYVVVIYIVNKTNSTTQGPRWRFL